MAAGERIDFAAAGLLAGLKGKARREREELLGYLIDQGWPVEELQREQRTNGDGALVFMAAEKAVGGPERFTQAEVSERSGLELGFLESLRQAMALPAAEPDDPAYGVADIESARLAAQALALGISQEELLDVTRVLGRGLAQAAEVMRAMTLRLVLEPGLSERELAERFAYAAAGMAPMTVPLVGHLLTSHLLHMAQGEAINAAERSQGRLSGAREITVAFADLVGFTRVGEEVQPDELGHLAERLETLASEAVRTPVRLVKTLGDGVMFAAHEPEPLVASTLALVAAADAEGESFPQLRAGAAQGPAINRAGDWFGRPVNLASRVTAIARPGSVLVTQAVRDATLDAFKWSFAGPRHLKGVRGTVTLFRARPLGSGGDAKAT